MAYADNFVSVRHDFLISAEYTAVERLILIWLASKPADWDVRQAQIEKELHLGRQAVETALKSLRRRGAITKPKPKRNPDGTLTAVPGRLAIRSVIKHVPDTALRQPVSRYPGTAYKEDKTKKVSTAGPAVAGPGKPAVDPWADSTDVPSTPVTETVTTLPNSTTDKYSPDDLDRDEWDETAQLRAERKRRMTHRNHQHSDYP